LLAGHVHVGARALVGMGVTTIIGLRLALARASETGPSCCDVPEGDYPGGKLAGASALDNNVPAFPSSGRCYVLRFTNTLYLIFAPQPQAGSKPQIHC